MRTYPALDIAAEDRDELLAILDDFALTAVEDRDEGVRAFFVDAAARDAAQAALASTRRVSAVDVSDEDWARRSQENLQPVTIGRITIVPHATSAPAPAGPETIRLVIEPSMGFGTGHHATTRLCLMALQSMDLTGRRVLDVGTGSGVLALAADRLGAAEAIGFDIDADAVQSARENLPLNPDAGRTRFAVGDIGAIAGHADVVLANLTGALLVRAASQLRAAVAPGGVLIVSGLQSHERDMVVAALRPAKILWQGEEDNWIGLAMHL